MQEILSQTEDLVTDMVRLDALWRRELAPPTTSTDVIGELGSSSAPASMRRSRLDILVVEDEPKMARGLQRSLSTEHNVRVASSKRDALAQLRERAPHVLLCDHRLEWQKTDDLFEHVRDNYPRVRRVLYSFSHLEVWNDLLQRKLVDAVVPKSAPRNALLAALFNGNSEGSKPSANGLARASSRSSDALCPGSSRRARRRWSCLAVTRQSRAAPFYGRVGR